MAIRPPSLGGRQIRMKSDRLAVILGRVDQLQVNGRLTLTEKALLRQWWKALQGWGKTNLFDSVSKVSHVSRYFLSIAASSNNNPIPLKAHCMVVAMFLHGRQSCPFLRDHVVALKGIYCCSLAVATNDVDNI